MSRPFRVTVFCSANANLEAKFFEEASIFARGMAERRWELLYGGASVGLMGHFANEALSAGGVVRGAITEGLAAGPEMAHRKLTELVIVKDLFDRKRWMMEKADAFAIFPGGYGTLDEALEVITWRSLEAEGFGRKPIVFVNIDGFWNSQIKAFEDFSARGMIRAGGIQLFQTVSSSAEALGVFDQTAAKTP